MTKPKLINPDLVKPLFDLNEKQPFLSRELTAYEKSIVNHWRHFYKTVIFPRGNAVNQSRDDFINYLARKCGYSTSQLRPERGNRDNLLFQNLFVSLPKVDLIRALSRITGLNTQLVDIEVENGFREFAWMKKSETGNFPRHMDFIAASKQRVFLPETGIIVPHVTRLQKWYAKKDPTKKEYPISAFYERFFKIPGEISRDEFARLCSLSQFSLQEIIENLKDVHTWMSDQTPNAPANLVPSRVDIERFARTEGGIPWNVYESWIYHGTELLAPTPDNAERSLEWLRKEAGLQAKGTYLRRPVNNPRGYWTPRRLLENYCEAWRVSNPAGYQPSRRILADPPTGQTLESFARTQAMILAKHGELLEAECLAHGVPTAQVPAVSTIREQYPGGLQKLLADIETRYRPDGGIRFSSGVQLQRMASMHLKKNAPENYAPVRVVRRAKELACAGD